MYELPAGWVDAHESPLEAAMRELREETGAIGTGSEFFELYAQPAFSSMKAYVCMLRVTAMKTASTGDDEDITTEWLELDRIKQLVRDGDIKDMGFLAALSIIGTKE